MTENVLPGESGAGMGLLDVVAAAAHDLTTPLSSILGLAQLLLADNVPDEATRREFLTIIHGQATQMARIVADLREMAALEAGAPIALDLESLRPEDLIDDVVARAKLLANQKQISLAILLEPGLPTLRTDRGRATQVLDNLLGNALKFTPAGGEVKLAAKRAASPDFVRISVADNGPGIPADVQSHIFDRFFRIDSLVDGRGLGLYINKRLAELLRGTIGVTSTAGEGSIFWIDLPVVVAHSGAVCRPQASSIDSETVS